jgi:hypothetical protein
LAKQQTDDTNSFEQQLSSEWKTAWEALQPLRATWDEKEQSLLAQTNDSVSGNITATRVSDAALSTLAFERQARVSAQLPSGKVYALSKADDEKAKLLNVVLNRYILPNADSQFDMLIKLRLWGVYASVYGSMPMFYDYRVDDRYIGPECYLVDPRCFAMAPGFTSVQDAPYVFISTIMSRNDLQAISERQKTSYDTKAVKKLLELAKGAKPTRDQDSTKDGSTVSQRYDKSQAKDRVEIVTKYEHDTWTSFAPDFEGLIIRKMDNPHKSGRIPVIMRHCFPLMNSVFGLGDFERGMKIQKAKDSIINLFLEGAKNRVYPPLKMIDSLLTPSTIKYQAGTKWKVKDQNAVMPMDFGAAPLNEFQATYASLQSMLQNQFGTSDTTISQKDSGNPAFGKTPEALKMLSARENARDTWDRFMHEKATEELLEGMLNLLQMKMEKPINFSVFEEDIKTLGYEPEQPPQYDLEGAVTDPGQVASEVPGMDVFNGAKAGKMTVNKKAVNSDVGFSYLIDSNSSMKQDDEEQFNALMATWNLMHQDPGLSQRLMQNGEEYDEAEHAKKIFIAAGIADWEKIIKEMSPEQMQAMQQQQMMAEQQAQQQQQAAQMQQQAPQDPGMAPQEQPQQQMPQDMGQPQDMSQQSPFQDPEIAAVAQQILGGING